MLKPTPHERRCERSSASQELPHCKTGSGEKCYPRHLPFGRCMLEARRPTVHRNGASLGLKTVFHPRRRPFAAYSSGATQRCLSGSACMLPYNVPSPHFVSASDARDRPKGWSLLGNCNPCPLAKPSDGAACVGIERNRIGPRSLRRSTAGDRDAQPNQPALGVQQRRPPGNEEQTKAAQ